MKKYVGTKQVEAEPMTMGEADNKKLVAIGSSRLSTYEKSSEGYHVKYDDGVETWLPKDEFEKTYRCSETSIDKMLIEAEDLQRRIEKISKILDSDNEIPRRKYSLLKAQYASMISYSTILVERIRMEKDEQNHPHAADCGCTCGCGCNCQEGKSSQAENAG